MLFQYPVKSEPVLPESLRPRASFIDEWGQPTNQPVLTPPFSFPAVHVSGEVGNLDPSVFRADPVNMADWFVPASRLVLRIPPYPAGGEVGNLDALVAGVDPVNMADWFVPASVPVRRIPPYPLGGGLFQGNPDDFVEPEVVADTAAGEYTARRRYILPNNMRVEATEQELDRYLLPFTEIERKEIVETSVEVKAKPRVKARAIKPSVISTQPAIVPGAIEVQPVQVAPKVAPVVDEIDYQQVALLLLL